MSASTIALTFVGGLVVVVLLIAVFFFIVESGLGRAMPQQACAETMVELRQSGVPAEDVVERARDDPACEGVSLRERGPLISASPTPR